MIELEELVPDRPRQPGPDYLGFAVPLRLRSSDGELRLLTTLTHFGTAVDVTIAELRLEAFLPADEATAAILTELVQRHPEFRSGCPAVWSRAEMAPLHPYLRAYSAGESDDWIT